MIFYGLAALTVAMVPTAGYLLFYNPGMLVRWFMDLYLYRAGLKVKHVKAGKYRWCYAEKGQPQEDKLTLVFIHGFSASKDMFPAVVQKLPKDIHVVVPDMPGHGGTEEPADDDDIRLESLVEYLHQLLEEIGLTKKPFHLAGTSMGGAVVFLYAVRYPSEVARLSLICPAMITPIETDFMKGMRESNSTLLLPKTPDQMLTMINACAYHKVKIPKLFLQGLFQLREKKNKFNFRLFQSLEKEMQAHDEYAELGDKLTMPTQVIWGKDDEILHVSGAELLNKELPNCQRVDLIEKCGHSINMDRPGSLAKYLLEFRKDVTDKKQD